jgi:hypothetical protein
VGTFPGRPRGLFYFLWKIQRTVHSGVRPGSYAKLREVFWRLLLIRLFQLATRYRVPASIVAATACSLLKQPDKQMAANRD